MPTVAVQKNQELDKSGSIFDEIARIGESIRRRAYELFEARGGDHGSDVDDWLNAENELVCCPESEFTDNEKSYEIRVSLPGFQPDDIQVTALPDELIVKAEASRKHEETREGVEVSEFGQRTFLRRFSFSQPVDIEAVTAQLNGEELHLTIPKVNTAQSVKVTANNAAAETPTDVPAAANTTSAEPEAPQRAPRTATASRG